MIGVPFRRETGLARRASSTAVLASRDQRRESPFDAGRYELDSLPRFELDDHRTHRLNLDHEPLPTPPGREGIDGQDALTDEDRPAHSTPGRLGSSTRLRNASYSFVSGSRPS